MAKKKEKPAETTEATSGPDALRNRIVLFFQTLPYGHVGTLAQLGTDLPEFELKKLVTESMLDDAEKSLTARGYELPKAKADKESLFLAIALETAVESMVKDGTLIRQAVTSDTTDSKSVVGMGYKYNGVKPAGPVGRKARLPIDQVKVDEKLQMRANGTDQKKVAEYAAVADQLPEVDVFHTTEDDYLLAGGFTRMGAFRQAGFADIPVTIYEGTRADAEAFALTTNASHGQPRTSADIAKAVGTYLKKNKNASTASVANACKIGWATADNYRKKWHREQEAAKKERQAKGEAEPADETTGQTAVPEGYVMGADGKIRPATITQPVRPPKDEADPKAAPAPPPGGVTDRIGNPVPLELVPVFHDTRFADKVREMLRAQQFIRELETDGYAFSALDVKTRNGVLNTIESELQTLMYSSPYALTPADADPKRFADAVERRWMTEVEYRDYVPNSPAVANNTGNGKKSKKGKKKDEPTAEPVPTAEPFAAEDGQVTADNGNLSAERLGTDAPVNDNGEPIPAEVPSDAESAAVA